MDKAQEEGKEEMSVLKKPFRIELRKTAVVASYRAYLIGVSLWFLHTVDSIAANYYEILFVMCFILV